MLNRPTFGGHITEGLSSRPTVARAVARNVYSAKSEAAGCISRPLELVAGRGLEPLASGL